MRGERNSSEFVHTANRRLCLRTLTETLFIVLVLVACVPACLAQVSNRGGNECRSLLTKKGNRWIIDDQAVESAGGNVEALFDCIPEKGVAALDTEVLALSKSLVLRYPVALQSAKQGQTSTRVVVRCPEDQPALIIRSEGVTVSDLYFANCNLNGSSIVTVLPNSNVTLQNSQFLENINTDGPACIAANNATLQIKECLFALNSGVEAGAVHMANDSILHISHSVFERNSAKMGGALRLANSSAVVGNSLFFANEAEDEGGGIHIVASAVESVLDVHNVEFKDNRISRPSEKFGSGGAVYMAGTVNSTFSGTVFHGNSAQLNGGAMYSGNATQIEILNSSFVENACVNGGAIAAQGFTRPFRLLVTESLFRNNTAPGGFGGAVCVTGNGSFLAFIEGGTEFIENGANEGGAIWAQATWGPAVNITINNTYFFGNGAGEAGAGGLTTVGQVIATVNNATFEKNSAVIGGAINVFDRAKMNISRSRFVGNHASKAGGAVFFEHNDHNTRSFQSEENMEVLMNETVFIDNTAGDSVAGISKAGMPSLSGGGGAITITGAGTYVELNHSIVENNVGLAGGAVCWMQGGTLLIGDVEFNGNKGVQGGAINAQTLDGITKDFDITNSSFTGNTAQRGGAMTLFVVGDPFKNLVNLNYSEGRTATFINVDFENNTASDMGGAVQVEEVLLDCQGCHFSFNRAGLGKREFGAKGKGGAMVIGTKATVVLNASSVEGNVAEKGGGIFVLDGVLNASAVRFADNVANEKGGAVALEYGASVTTASGFLMKATSCNMTGNEARVGGGIYFAVAPPWSEFQQCANLDSMEAGSASYQQQMLSLGPACHGLPDFLHLLKNRRILLNKTVLMDNRAVASGAAIFTSDPGLVKICCGGVCKLVEDKSMQHPCESAQDALWGNNTVTGGNEQTVVSAIFSQVDLVPARIVKHSSGDTLERIKVTLMDPFWQVASGKNVTLVVSLVEEPNRKGMISGNPTTGVLLERGISTVSGINMRAQPGNYTLQFAFTPEQSLAQTIVHNVSVEVRECWLGEVYEESSMSCLPCDQTSFSFNTSGSCQSCPANAVCNASTVTPVNGFWHATSQSAKLKQCIFREACSFEQRGGELGRTAFLAHRRGDVLRWGDDRYGQCAKGYDGPLCGSCQEDYGRIGAAQCGKCAARGYSLFLAFLAFLILFGVSAYLTRQAMQYGKEMERLVSRQQASMNPLRESQNGNGAQGTEMEERGEAQLACIEIEAEVPQHVPTNGKHEETRPRLEANQTMEVMKILINFLQVIGTAAAINAHWTESVVNLLSLSEYLSGVSSGNGLLSFECAFGMGGLPRSIKSYIAQTLAPFAIWAILTAFWAFKAMRGRLTKQKLKQRVIVSVLVILYIIYINMTKKVVRMFNCVPIDLSPNMGREHALRYWAEDTDVVCYRQSHAVLMGLVGAPLLVFVVAGFPLGLILKLRVRKADLNDFDFVGRYGFLYRAYKESACFWEAFVLLRKGVLATIVVFTEPLGPEQQTTLAAIALALALLLQNHYRPYNQSTTNLNNLESWSLTVSMFVCLSGVIFSENQDNELVKLILSVFVICSVVGYVLFLLYALTTSGKESLENWLSNQGLEATGNLVKDAKMAGVYLVEMGDEKFNGIVRRVRDARNRRNAARASRS